MDMKAVEVVGRIGRKHSEEFRSAVLAACDAPGARVSEVAARHGVTASLVYKWRQRAARIQKACAPTPSTPAGFIPLRVDPAPADPVRVEFCRRDVTVRLSWSVPALDDLARLLRSVLQ